MNVNELKKKSNRRVDTGYLRNLGIQSYGDDNLYPQHLRNIIAASSTGSECAERYANFIEGNGFREVAFSEYVVNRRGEYDRRFVTFVTACIQTAHMAHFDRFSAKNAC